MGKWLNLTALLKAQVIKFAILNGVSDIKTIRDTFNIYADEGNLAHKKSGEELGETSWLNNGYNSSKDWLLLMKMNTDLMLQNLQSSPFYMTDKLLLDLEFKRLQDATLKSPTSEIVSYPWIDDKGNEIIKTVPVVKGLNTMWDAGVVDWMPVLGDGKQVTEAVGAATLGNYLAAGLLGGLMLVPNAIEKPLKKVFSKIAKTTNPTSEALATAVDYTSTIPHRNLKELFKNTSLKEASNLIHDPKFRGLLAFPFEDIAIYRDLPDDVLDIYSAGVIPRLVEQRPWLNVDDFVRSTENALLYRAPGYAVYPEEIFRTAGLKKAAGLYSPITGQISIVDGYVLKALPHEIRHKLDDAIDLTLAETDFLQNAFGDIFSGMKGFQTSNMADEMVTTNLDSRLKLLGRHATSDVKILNALIDKASDDLIFKAVELSNSYGNEFIKILREQGLLTPEKAQAFRESMKYVGALAAPAAVGISTIENNNTHSTGGPLYPFSFEKNPYFKTPVVRY